MKKVLLIAPLPPPYGGISHWTAMVFRYSRRGGRVPLKVIDTAPRHTSIFERSFIKRVLPGVPGLVSQVVRALKALPSRNLLAVHVTTAGHYGLLRDVGFLLLARTFKHRCVLHIRFGRVPEMLGSRGIQSSILRLGFKIASHVVAIDSATARAIRESLPSVKVSRVPNCIDLESLPNDPNRKEQTILFVGWVLRSKGVGELLGAWSRIGRPDWRLKIVGPCSSEFAVKLAEKYQSENIEFSGEKTNSEVLTEMSRAAIFCLPSYTEGFPNVILEAMALGCAVVATPVGAIPEMLSGGAGVTVGVKDEVELGDQLNFLMDNPVVRDRMSSLAVERVKKEYAIDRVYRTYEAIWNGQ